MACHAIHLFAIHLFAIHLFAIHFPTSRLSSFSLVNGIRMPILIQRYDSTPACHKVLCTRSYACPPRPGALTQRVPISPLRPICVTQISAVQFSEVLPAAAACIRLYSARCGNPRAPRGAEAPPSSEKTFFPCPLIFAMTSRHTSSPTYRDALTGVTQIVFNPKMNFGLSVRGFF